MRSFLVQPSFLVGLTQTVLQKVASLRILGHKVDTVVDFNALNQVNYVLALPAQIERGSLRNLILAFRIFVGLLTNFFNCDLSLSGPMGCEHNRVSSMFGVRALKKVLLKLVAVALGAHNSI